MIFQYFPNIVKSSFFLFILLGVFCKNIIAGEVSQEYQLKAAYLYNFARFISWPEHRFSNDDRFLNICIVGTNPFDTILSKLETKKIDNHPIKVLYYRDASKQQCHISFYAYQGTDASFDFDVLGQNTVNVSDIGGFVEAGGDIELILKSSRLQFIINNTSLKKKGFQPRASLLELAEDIR